MKFGLAIITALSVALIGNVAQAEVYRIGQNDLAIADTEEKRPLDGYLWYPTMQQKGQKEAHGNAVWEGIQVVPDAEPHQDQHPLVVLSHGTYGNARNQVWLAEKLVQRGYVVAAINHPGTSTFHRDPTESRKLWERSRDISRVIDYLLTSAQYGTLIDQERIFMAGHSLGGFTAMTLAGGRYDPIKFNGFCENHPDDIACRVLDGWNVAKTPEDQLQMSADLSDSRIAGFAVFDLGGTQSFSSESLETVKRPLLVYGAPLDIQGLDLDIESRALVKALPKDNVRYLEPPLLSHFDFLGTCKPNAINLLKEEEPADVFICVQGIDERRAKHNQIAAEVIEFFNGL